jgi:hypothetical protein
MGGDLFEDEVLMGGAEVMVRLGRVTRGGIQTEAFFVEGPSKVGAGGRARLGEVG